MAEKIEKFGRATAKVVSELVTRTLNEALAKYGVTAEVRGGRFTEAEFTPQLVLKLPDADRIAFETYAEMFELKKSDFGREFTRFNGETAKLVAIRPSRPKFPMVVEIRGKRVLLTNEEVLYKLGYKNSPGRPVLA